MSYKKLLLTAREAADLRLQEKGLSPTTSRRTSESEDDDSMLVTGGLVPRRKAEINKPQEDLDFMTEYFTMLREENQNLKNSLSEGYEVAADKFDFSNFESQYGSSDVGEVLTADLQEALGLSRVHAAAIVGNLAHETGDFKFMQELRPIVPGSKGGAGFAQWTGKRRKAFEKFVADNDYDINSYEANRDFLIYEIQETDEGRFLSSLEKTTTVEDAAKVVSNKYLRPGIPKIQSRIEKAKRYVGGN